ncbi:hypothetical protein SESBI_46395 [Sesbania bispinosa]|nr:hypothetical protein SESBI_46395 [Sesbania bispinosa]
MPKVKRFQNPQRSAPQPQHDASPPIPAPAYSSPTMNANEPSPSVEAPSNFSPPIEPSPTHEISQEEIRQEKIPQEVPTSRHVVRESPQYWNVDAIGPLKVLQNDIADLVLEKSGLHLGKVYGMSSMTLPRLEMKI